MKKNFLLQGGSKMRVAISVLTLAAVIGTNTAPLAAKTFSCPPYNGLPVGPNLLKNPDFDNAGPCGTFTWWWQLLSNCPPNYSAAAGWLVHSSNQNDYVSTQLVQPSTLPIGGGPSMMHILQRHGNEGGIYQQLPFGLQKFMASVWVFVTRPSAVAVRERRAEFFKHQVR
jgi:hypothetical protein